MIGHFCDECGGARSTTARETLPILATIAAGFAASGQYRNADDMCDAVSLVYDQLVRLAHTKCRENAKE
jgi:hypothetical protein